MGSWREFLAVVGIAAGVLGCTTRAVQSTRLETPPVSARATPDPSGQTAQELDRYRQLLTDPDPGIRIAAARVLIEHGDLEGKPILLGALRSSDSLHRIDAALALRTLEDLETIAQLRRAAEVERHPMAHRVLKEVLEKTPQ